MSPLIQGCLASPRRPLGNSNHGNQGASGPGSCRSARSWTSSARARPLRVRVDPTVQPEPVKSRAPWAQAFGSAVPSRGGGSGPGDHWTPRASAGAEGRGRGQAWGGAAALARALSCCYGNASTSSARGGGGRGSEPGRAAEMVRSWEDKGGGPRVSCTGLGF